MKLVKATVTALKTSDGLVEFKAHVEVGQVYEVDLDSRERVPLFNVEHNRRHVKEIIYATNGRWLPTELLQLQEDRQ